MKREFSKQNDERFDQSIQKNNNGQCTNLIEINYKQF